MEISLNNAKSYAKWYNILAFVCMIAVYSSNIIVNLLILLYPVFGFLLIYFSEGLVKLFPNKEMDIWPIFPGYFIASLPILLSSTNSVNILDYKNMWLPALLVFMLLFLLLFVMGLNRSAGSVITQILIILVISTLYSFGSVLRANWVFDNSKPQIYTATISGYDIEYGKHRSYYFKLSAWGPNYKITTARVSQSFYNHTKLDDTVKVNYKKGLLNIPWFRVAK